MCMEAWSPQEGGCYRRNVTLPHIYMLRLYLQWDCVWRQEVIKVECGHKGGARFEKISVLIRGTRKLVLFPLSCEGIARSSQPVQARKKALTRTQPFQTWSETSSLQNCENITSVKPLSLWYFVMAAAKLNKAERLTFVVGRGRKGFSWFPQLSADLPPFPSSLPPNPSFRRWT